MLVKNQRRSTETKRSKPRKFTRRKTLSDDDMNLEDFEEAIDNFRKSE